MAADAAHHAQNQPGRANGPERTAQAATRVGHGWDRHRLEAVQPGEAGLIVAGVRLDADRRAAGHSDGDVVFHAVTDALLGAVAAPDIGTLFPDDDRQWAGAASAVFVREAMRLVREAGLDVVNVDVTVVCERPKINALKEAMCANLAAAIGCERSCVNIKGKTGEGVDAAGEGRAIEAHAVVLLGALLSAQ